MDTIRLAVGYLDLLSIDLSQKSQIRLKLVDLNSSQKVKIKLFFRPEYLLKFFFIHFLKIVLIIG